MKQVLGDVPITALHNIDWYNAKVMLPKVLGTKKSIPYFVCDLSESNKIENLNDLIIFEELRNAAMSLSNEEASILALARSITDWRLNNNYCPKCGDKTKTLKDIDREKLDAKLSVILNF